MGFRDRVEKVGPAHYVLAPVGDMRCPVDAWLDEGLFAQTDESLWRQAALAAAYPGAQGLHLMPDTHLGYGIPVGGVLVTDQTIVQAGSGYDISCGVVYMKARGLAAADVVDWERRRQWVDAVEARVATGIGNHRPRLAPQISHRLVEDVLFNGAKALGVSADLCERHAIEVDPQLFDRKRVPKAAAKAQPQLGSVGGGNHFIEMQVDRDDGSVWVMVHCGSRGYGWQTANHFFYEGAALRGLPKNQREASWLRADEPLGRRYWAHHNSAANYAVANRHTIVDGVGAATEEV
ncbi:MAG: RtcB family protein, partial [Myxococcales bacterium]|nr:RtcB family protein [Myxococcales bacterium]